MSSETGSHSEKSYISGKNVLLLIVGLIIGLGVGVFLPRWVPGLQGQVGGASASQAEAAEQLLADLEVGEAREVSEASGSSSVKGAGSYNLDNKLGTLPIENKDDYLKYMLENTDEELEHLEARWNLSKRFQDSGELRGVSIEGFLRTPREHFVREKNYRRAYDDTWLPIGYGATITDPDVVAMMTTTLKIAPDDKVLEIGTGSGYQSAILSNISNHVYSIEIIEPLFYETNGLYSDLADRYPQYTNITRKLGDGYYGWEEYAPFDKIIVTCAIDHLPPPLLQQLSPGGIMVVPLGNPGRQYIMEVKKTFDEDNNIILKRRDVYNGLAVRFIPFRDEEGNSYSKSAQ